MPRQLLRHGMFFLGLVGLMGISPALFGQAPAAPSTDLKTLRAQIDTLSVEVGVLRNRVADLESRADKAVSRTDFDPVKNQVDKLNADLGAVTALVQTQNAEIRKLFEDHKKNLDLLIGQVAEQRRILEAISTQDNAGRPIVNLQWNMESGAFRDAMRSAVHQSLDGYGTLEIENRLPAAYTISVNGTYYTVPGSSTQFVRVPVGTVVTELVGYESPKHWTIAPPTYRQRVIIGPAPRTAYYGWSEWVWDPWLGAWVRRYYP